MLYLSGTPFNLYEDFNEDEIYTWDYIAEQQAKLKWSLEHLIRKTHTRTAQDEHLHIRHY